MPAPARAAWAISSGMNVVARIAALAGRFALTFYIAHFYGLEVLGGYGLIAGLAGIIPAAAGWGINYYVSRDLVGLAQDAAIHRMRDRLAISAISIGIVALVALYPLHVGLKQLEVSLGIVWLLLLLEGLSFDLHIMTISIGRSFLANAMLFVRSAGWLPLLVWLPIGREALSPIHGICLAWVAGSGVSLACSLIAVVGRKWRSAFTTKFDVKWLGREVFRSKLIYLNDLALVAQTYWDRYVIAAIVGLQAAGLYTLYWSVANSIAVLATVSVVQTAGPRLVTAHRSSGNDWRMEIWTQSRRGALTTILLAAFVTVGSWPTFLLIRKDALGKEYWVFLILVLGFTLKAGADLANAVLYSGGYDRSFAWTNIASAVAVLVIGVALSGIAGIYGAGTAVALVAGGGLLIRAMLVARAYRASR